MKEMLIAEEAIEKLGNALHFSDTADFTNVVLNKDFVRDLVRLIDRQNSLIRAYKEVVAKNAKVYVEERMSAKWEEVDNYLDEPDWTPAYDCSLCGAMVGHKCNFCPRCGAKMINAETQKKMMKVMPNDEG